MSAEWWKDAAVFWLPLVSFALVLGLSAWAATAWADLIVAEEERRKRDEDNKK